jgi:hypothetical protein
VITKEVGAVVLERAEQYSQNGLKDPDAVATPEPATWLLMGSALAALVWWKRKKDEPEGPSFSCH